MTSIEVANLQKTFQTKRKAAGLSGSLRALIKPDYSTVEAVRSLSFQMEAGELLGFIGPNGAGKSTTIKMLTGIFIQQRRGKVLGFTPWGIVKNSSPNWHGLRQRPQLVSLDHEHLFCSEKFTSLMTKQKADRISHRSL
jgi:ABC-type uncharacterized transport system ATPase subunit